MKKSLKILALIFLLWGGSMFRQGGFAFAQSLQIGSDFVILPNSAASPTCAVADKGKQYFNTTDNKMYFCNGMAWVDFSVGAFALPYSGNGNSAGVAFQIQQTGTSAAGNFVITNSSNSINALIGQTNCTGFAGRFNSSNATPKALQTIGALQLTGIGQGLNKTLASDASGNATWQNPVGFMYNRATAQSIVDGQETTILFNSMIFDSGNDYNGSTNPITANSGKFTAPADGLYHFDKAIDWDESFQATRVYLQIRHDNIGGTMKRMATQTGYFDNANTVEPHLSCSATFYMLANEKVYVRVSQNSNDGSPISHNLEPSVSCYFLGYLVR